jgi:hypothetical protein
LDQEPYLLVHSYANAMGFTWLNGLELPELPDAPGISLGGFSGYQRYHLELWAEKTTMHEILRPLCKRYGVALLAASGQLSITQVYDAAERIARDDRPARILYLSDLDPAGESMPVAAARKLEWFQHFATSPLRDELEGADIRLEKVVLTKEQGDHYHLPRTPMKATVDSEDWRNRYGEGGIELDALEALHPGELERILQTSIKRYYDTTLTRRVWEAQDAAREAIREHESATLAAFQDEINTVTGEYDALKAEISPKLAELAAQFRAFSARMRAAWGNIEDALDEEKEQIDLDDYPVPEAVEVDEDDEALYDSTRDYEEQLGAYKSFQGKGEAPEGGAS